MPLYEYQCQECGEKLEAIQKFSEDPYTICSHCGGALKKLVSSPAIKFKGSGFYITDYAKRSSNAESKGETKSESKSETKSESSASKSESSASKSESSTSSAPASSSSEKS